MTDKIDYSEQLKRLEAGDIDKIVVKPEQFMDFQSSFMNYDKRKRIIGTADQGGVVTYIFERDDQRNDS
ncbi:MAG: hypothetical protein ABF679_02890 [Lentilactobacillus diolivorans]|jgi:hypothetical protein|uniref:Uncharacterized protein n=2 Tax=Lentilactobacillus diolivorans TaxID=179838 RepID=A0A0R1S020_9LACO|nr:hypothetical protein [Lentilactobacillus diolivorans]RRG01138.1 MAG: hypothetical protein DUD34_13230 [Lactobacillus sp.]KRL62582.1 hypothetical protein FC85_GL001820 [Lentilactobacillus diolivorans DSM 14421]MCH4165306.1 hypothetical protein [Lentilactobacillus diolivorans]MDH5104660.1 hypothetical protein [Lentilactobacillus diolivorans]GEP24762.1 hypothetical protein LDI01_23550 [Lentilactobacillus diolivorans]